MKQYVYLYKSGHNSTCYNLLNHKILGLKKIYFSILEGTEN